MQLDSYNCVLCNLSIEETSTHLFLNCPFAKECWSSIGITFQDNISAAEAVMQIRSQSSNRFFMSSAILMSWAIWTVRNDFIFKNFQPEVEKAKEIFKKETHILSLRAKAKDSILFDQWIQNLL
jgi:pectin methylesterase-like acyl-CoA thioesterase